MKFSDKIKYFFRDNPIIVILIILLLVKRIARGEALLDIIFAFLISVPALIIGITVHEAAHAYTAYYLGDPTPKAQGRLSLNPLNHIDPMGMLWLIIVGIGWGKPVEISPVYFKHRRRDEFFVSIAGIVANFIVATLFSFLYKLLVKINYTFAMEILLNIILQIVYINLVLMLFNLLPCPPLDGFNIITQIFKLDRYEWWYKLMHYGTLILMIVIILDIPSLLISKPFNFLFSLLLN